MSDKEILSAALKLPARKREKIAEAILGSIKSPSQRHIEALWAQEAESRVAGLLKGRIRSVPGEDVLAHRRGPQ